MRRHWMVATALAATLLAGLFAAPAAPAAEAKFGMERKTYIVKTRVGKIYMEVVHPTRNGKTEKHNLNQPEVALNVYRATNRPAGAT